MIIKPPGKLTTQLPWDGTLNKLLMQTQDIFVDKL